MNRRARLIGRMDSRIRFEKAIESGPPVCRAHIVHVVGIGRAEHVAGVQGRKPQALTNRLSQPRIHRSDELDELFAKAVTYLETPISITRLFPMLRRRLAASRNNWPKGPRELTQWDEEQRMVIWGISKTKWPVLRYDNAVLAEENPKLKLAYAAVQAIRHDLEP